MVTVITDKLKVQSLEDLPCDETEVRFLRILRRSKDLLRVALCFSHSIARVDVNFNYVYSSILCFQISTIQLRLHPSRVAHSTGTLTFQFLFEMRTFV